MGELPSGLEPERRVAYCGVPRLSRAEDYEIAVSGLQGIDAI
jgi:hypothetical protein